MAKFLVLLMVMAAFAVQIAVSDVCDDVEDIPALITDATTEAIAEGKALVAAEVAKVQAAIDASPAPSAAAKACYDAIKTANLATIVVLKTSAKTKLKTCIEGGLTKDPLKKEIEAICIEGANCNGIISCLLQAFFQVFDSAVDGIQAIIKIFFGGSNEDPKEVLEEKVEALVEDCIDNAVESVADDITDADIATKMAACAKL